MTGEPVTDPDVLAAFNSKPPSTKPVTDASVIAAFGNPRASHLIHGGAYAEDPDTPEWQAKYGPTSNRGSDAAQLLDNYASALGSFWPTQALGAKQIAAQVSGGDPYKVTEPFTGVTAEEKAKFAGPLNRTMGGFLGRATPYAALPFIPGANTVGGATALGTALGALQPTSPGESRLVNAGIGGALGGSTQALGAGLGRWAANRADQPLMGWNPSTASRAAAESVGSDAPKLTQPALAEAHARLSDVFNRARSPNISVSVGDTTTNTIERLTQGIENDTSRTAFANNSAVRDLTSHLGENPSAETLGQISSRLGNEARSVMSTKGSDKVLGRSLFQLQDHVDDLIGGSIKDPELAAQYAQARPQYRNYMMLTGSASRLNSATGEFNATATGKYLQRADPAGYTRGGNTSPLYEAARWGQATGAGKGAPPFTIENLGGPFIAHYAANNPVSRLATGLTSRAVAPVSGATGQLAQALALAQKNRLQEPAQRLIRAEQAQ